jgi:glycosyltransferase involved in cell wall biosynthesis
MTTAVILPTSTHGSGGDFYDRMLLDHLRKQDEELHIFTLPATIRPPRSIHTEILDFLSHHHCDRIIEDTLCYRSLTALNTQLRKQHQRPLITALVHTMQSFLESGPTQPTVREEERRFYQTIDNGIWVSNHTRTATHQLLGSPLPGIVAYPGKDHLKSRGKRPRRSETLRVLFVGAIIDYKGLDTLVSALTTMDSTAWELLVVGVPKGDPRYLRRIQTVLRDTRHASQVIFAGYLPHIVLPQIYASHDILVGPSWYEGYGLTYVEALGSDMPVIATANGGPSEYLADGADSFLLLPGDVSRLRSLLDLVAASPDHLATLSAHTKTTYANLPTWKQSLDRIWDYLNHTQFQTDGKNQ